MKKKTVISAILAATMVFSLAACGGGQSGTAATTQAETAGAQETGAQTQADGAETQTDGAEAAGHKDTLIIALPAEPATLDPYAHSNQNGFICTTLIFDTLIRRTDDGEYEPRLAKEWEMVDDTTIRFVLRDDVTFHDGSKFTAEDVKFSLGMAAESSFSKNLFGCVDIENTNVIDDNTIEVKLQYAYAPFLEALASHRGAIIPKAAYESMGAEAFARAPIGTGPMKFKEWVTGDRIEFDKYDDFWGEPMAFDNFVARVIVEASSRTIELETGGVDIAFELAPADWNRIDENPETQLISGNTQGVSFLCLNNSLDPIKDNENLRKALAYGLNLEALVQTAWQGTADVADSYYSSTIFGHKAVGPMEYNPDKAKELLAEAGYPDGLTITYMTYESTVNQAFAEVLQNMWGQIGVTVDIQMIDLATFTEKNNNGEIPCALMTNTAVIPDPDAALLAWPTHRTISLRHNDTHIDELLEKGKSIYDSAERQAVYEELQDYLWEKMYTIPIAFPRGAYGATSQVANLPFYANLCPDLTRVKFQ